MAAIANLALSDESHSLTSEELQFYNALKDELGAGISDDFAIRVTRAFRSNKKNRMQVTIEEGKKILQWRAQYDLDNILLRQLDRSKIYNDSWPTWIYGEDCQGHLVAVDRVGDIQIDKFQANFDTVEKLIEHRAQYMERIQWEKAAISKRLGHRIYRHICIVDLKGLCMKHLSRSVIAQLKPIFDLGQLYYPETLQRLYIVNAPAIFYGAWKVISALIDPEVREKIQVFKDTMKFLEEAQKHGIPLSSLPTYLGGTHEGRVVDNSFQPSVCDTPLPVSIRSLQNPANDYDA